MILLLATLLTSGCGAPAPAPEPQASPTGPVTVVTLSTPGAGDEAAASAGHVRIAQDAAQVRIRLAGIDRPAGELMAELEALDTAEIRRWPVDAADGDGLSITVPAYAMAAGGHVLTLWAGDADLLRRYRFTVTVE